ncbi:MAG: transketolase [Streptosporangiales bacterium]|nr:transketolase [Streptosporangiales bacterium]
MQGTDDQARGVLRPEHETARRAAARIRLRAVRMVGKQGFGYLGQALSSAELMAVLFTEHLRSGIDRFVLSPAHYVIAAYAAAVDLGMLTEEQLATYGDDDSALEAIGTERTPVVDLTCGSLGQGLSGAIGLALAARLRAEDRTVYAFVSDGEMEEGQLWEAAMFAAHHGLANLVVLLDCNNSQVDGPVSDVTTVEPVTAKWQAFGWHAEEVDGHDVAMVSAALGRARSAAGPAVVVARTNALGGITCLPGGADAHFVKLTPELVEQAVAELEEAIRG